MRVTYTALALRCPGHEACISVVTLGWSVAARVVCELRRPEPTCAHHHESRCKRMGAHGSRGLRWVRGISRGQRLVCARHTCFNDVQQLGRGLERRYSLQLGVLTSGI